MHKKVLLWGHLGRPLGTFWTLLDGLRTLLGTLGTLLGRSWGALGHSWRGLGRFLGAISK